MHLNFLPSRQAVASACPSESYAQVLSVLSVVRLVAFAQQGLVVAAVSASVVLPFDSFVAASLPHLLPILISRLLRLLVEVDPHWASRHQASSQSHACTGMLHALLCVPP